VGGGYPEDQLSLVSLEWIMGEAMASGLKLDPAVVKQISTTKSPYGRLYDSRAGLSAYYRYSPRQVPVPSHQGTEIRPIIHGSVVLRMAHGSDRYAPISLPRRFWVLAPGGELLPMEGFDEKLELDTTKTRQAGAGLTSEQAAQTSTVAADLQKAMRGFEPPARDVVSLVWDTVWWRRIFYFATVLLTAALVLRPWLGGFFAEATRASLAQVPHFGDTLSSAYDDFLGKIDTSSQGVVTMAVDTANGFIPGYFKPWIEAFQRNPAEFTALILAIIASLYVSSFLDTRIRDRAWLAWHPRRKGDYLEWIGRSQSGWRAGMVVAVVAAAVLVATAILRGWPPFAQAGLATVAASLALLLIWRLAQRARFGKAGMRSESLSIPNTLGLSVARKLRNNKVVLTLSRWIFERAVPIAFAFGVIVLGLFLINRILFDVASAAGLFCKGTPKAEWVKPNSEIRKQGFTTGTSCWPTGIELDKGHRYRIKLETPGDWFNGTLRSDVEGYGATTLSDVLATGLKRWWGKDWFKPIARIGARGNNEIALDPVSPFKPQVYCTDPGTFGRPTAASDSVAATTAVLPDTDKCGQRPTAAARQKCACKQCSRQMARSQNSRGIGSPIGDEQASAMEACSPTPDARKVLSADITASSSGELFLYVNDAVLMWPHWRDAFYANNRGTGTVTVTPY
jgi:hypothetical protein